MCCKFFRGFLRLAGLCLLLTGPASLSPVYAQASNTVTAVFNFVNLTGNAQGAVRFQLIPVQDQLSGTNFLLASPIRANVTTAPSLTNGSFTTAALCGVNYRGEWSDGYSTSSTNFYFQLSDIGTTVPAANRAGGVGPGGSFFYASPIVTNVIIGTSGTNASSVAGTSSIIVFTNGSTYVLSVGTVPAGNVSGKVASAAAADTATSANSATTATSATTAGTASALSGSITLSQVSDAGNASRGDTNIMKVASSANADVAVSVSGAVNANQLTGVVPASTVPYVSTTNTAATVYNDTIALNFLNTIGVADEQARKNLITAVNDLYASGVITNVISAGLLDPLYNPTRHLDLFLNPLATVNEQYVVQNSGIAGLNCRGTNYLTLNIGSLTNFDLFVWYWQSPARVDSNPGSGPFDGCFGQSVAALYDTNTWGGFVFDDWSPQGGSQAWASPMGTNFNYYQNAFGISTNRSWEMLNGGYSLSSLPVGIPRVFEYSGNTNGLCSIHVMSKPSIWANAANHTNVLGFSSTPNYNQLWIGGAGTNFGSSSVGQSTNAYCVIGGYILFNRSAENNPAQTAAGYKFSTDVMRYSSAVGFNGDSLVNDACSANLGPNNSVPETNSMINLFAAQNPTVLTICDAAPGSAMLSYSNQSSIFTNSWAGYSMLNLNTNRYPNRIIETDSGANDVILFGASLANVLSAWGAFYNPYVNAGVPVFVIDRHWDYSATIAQNYSWKIFQAALQTNYTIAGTIHEADYVTTNVIFQFSRDNPPVHPDALTMFAHIFNEAYATLCSFKPWPLNGWEVQQMTIQSPVNQDLGITNMGQLFFETRDAFGNRRFTQDGSGMTNQPFFKTMSVTGGSVSYSVNADGSTNVSLTISSGTGNGNALTNSSGYQIWTGGTNITYGSSLGSNNLNTTGWGFYTNGNGGLTGNLGVGGTVTATTLSGTHTGSGASLTSLSAANLSSGGTSTSNQWMGRFTGDGEDLTNRVALASKTPQSLVNSNDSAAIALSTMLAANLTTGGKSSSNQWVGRFTGDAEDETNLVALASKSPNSLVSSNDSAAIALQTMLAANLTAGGKSSSNQWVGRFTGDMEDGTNLVPLASKSSTSLVSSNDAAAIALQTMRDTNLASAYTQIFAAATTTNINFQFVNNGNYWFTMTNCAALTNFSPINGAIRATLWITNSTGTTTNFYITAAARSLPPAGTGLTTNAIPVPAGGIAQVWVDCPPNSTNYIDVP